MQTITRHVASVYTSPERVPTYDRAWRRAVSALNIAGDEYYLTAAVFTDLLAANHTATAVLAAAPLTVQHATAAKLVEADTNVAFLPPATPVMVLTTAAPNSPNTRPAALPAVGPAA